MLFRTKQTWMPSTRELGVLAEYEWNRKVTLGFTYEYPVAPIGIAAKTAGTFELITIFRLDDIPATSAYDIKTRGAWTCGKKNRRYDPFKYVKKYSITGHKRR